MSRYEQYEANLKPKNRATFYFCNGRNYHSGDNNKNFNM